MSSEWSKYLATGIPVRSGESVPSRKEISLLDSVELILLYEGLAKFQNERPPDDPKSWFQIAGIHGLPYTTWPNKPWNKGPTGVPNSKPPPPGERKGLNGFCTHSSILFLTWHRPYLALFESILYEHVQDFVKGIREDTPSNVKQAYVKAAKTFRLPFWDWARRDEYSMFPKESLSNSYDRSKVPRSSTSWFEQNPKPEVYNPLFQFAIPEKVRPLIGSYGQWGTTKRYPSGVAKDMTDMTDAFHNRKWQDRSGNVVDAKNLSERTYYLLSAYKRFSSVSYNRLPEDPDSTGRPPKPEIWGSLEDTHNSVHGNTGGAGGFMSNPAVAAFDPIFWLHHCNIDRLFAIWQALTEDDKNTASAWVTPQPSLDSSWSTLKGDVEGKKTPLLPFKVTEDTWYDSQETGPTSVRRTEAFGYNYEELASVRYPLDNNAKRGVTNAIKLLYTNLPVEIQRSRAGDPKAGDMFLPQASILKRTTTPQVTANHTEFVKLAAALPKPEALLEESLGDDKPFIKDLAPNGEYLEWLINVKAEKHALGGQYSVHFFLNAVEEDNVSLWNLSPHHVGAFVPFGQSQDTGCENCKDQQASHLEITGQIPLTIALTERYLAQIIPDLTPETVVPYLTKNLHWRAESGGTILNDRSQVGGLTVFVVSNKVTVPDDANEPPIYDDDVTVYPEVTTNMNGSGRGDGTGLSQY